MRMDDVIPVRPVIDRETGERVTVDDRTFNPKRHREVDEADEGNRGSETQTAGSGDWFPEQDPVGEDDDGDPKDDDDES